MGGPWAPLHVATSFFHIECELLADSFQGLELRPALHPFREAVDMHHKPDFHVSKEIRCHDRVILFISVKP